MRYKQVMQVGDSTRKKLYIPVLDFYDEEEYTPVAEVYYDERGT